MKVLHVSAQKPDSTGSGIYMSGIINGFRKLNIKQCAIVGIDISNSIEKIEVKFGNEVGIYPVVYNSGVLDFNIPGMSDSMPYNSTRYRDLTSEQTKFIISEFSKLILKVVEIEQPDLIICHHLYLVTSLVRELCPNTKVVAICHGTCIRQILSTDFEREYILNKIKSLDMIFALHEEQKNSIEEIYDVEPEKVVVLGSGYDSEIFFDDKKEKNGVIQLAYAGKISYSKGLVQLVTALEKSSIDPETVKVVMAGDNGNKDELKDIMEMSSKSKYNIEFTGRINQRQLAEMFNQSDIFILPSFYEGLPLVVLEAMACGCYVICTDVAGIKQWLGDEINNSGLLDYVKLPKMKSVSVPAEEDICNFEDRLTFSIEKAVNFRKKDRKKSLDISYLSWNGLANKLYKMIQEV